MIYNKHNFKSPLEGDFPFVDIEKDASLTINEILYNVSHGLPTGIAEPYMEYDDDDDDNPMLYPDDKFDAVDLVHAAYVSEDESVRESANDESAGTERPKGSEDPALEE